MPPTFLSDDEARERLAAGAPGLSLGRDAPGVVARPGSIETLPPGRVLALARAAVRWALGDDAAEALLWVREHGVWASSEHRSLERALRGPGSGTLEDRPAFAADRADAEFVVGYLYLAWCFGWGVTVAADGAGGARAVCSDHDGHVWAAAADAGDRDAAGAWTRA